MLDTSQIRVLVLNNMEKILHQNAIDVRSLRACLASFQDNLLFLTTIFNVNRSNNSGSVMQFSASLFLSEQKKEEVNSSTIPRLQHFAKVNS